MIAARPAEAPRTRVLRWVLWVGSTLIIGLVLLMMVVAAITYMELSEPDSRFPQRLADAAVAAGEGGHIRMLALVEQPVDTLHLFAPGATTAAAIEACLGFPWDKAELIAGHLAEDTPGAFIAVADGEVVDYGWHLIGATPLRVAGWPCAITASDDDYIVTAGDVGLVLTLAPIESGAGE